MVCKVCGRQPAERFQIRRHVGMLVMQRFVTLDAPLCREHGLALSKDYLNKTLVQGWWGIISFFVNFVAVGVDLAAIRKAKKMAAPTGVAATPGQWAQPAGAPTPPPPAPPVPGTPPAPAPIEAIEAATETQLEKRD